MTTNKPVAKRQVVHSQTRELVRHIIEMCIEEKKNRTYTFKVDKVMDRVAYYTGLSKRTIEKIKAEGKEGGTPKTKSPKEKKIRRNSKSSVCLNSYDQQVIHSAIQEYYFQNKKVPTCPQLLVAIREKISFPWTTRTLQRLLKSMGYVLSGKSLKLNSLS